MVYVKINNNRYPASITGNMVDSTWDDRSTKSITMVGEFESVNALFEEGVHWSIVQETENEGGEIEMVEYDNSDYSFRGDLTVHTDGTCTVKMGKPTDLEDAYEMLFGGEM